MIASFADRDTETLFRLGKVRRIDQIIQRVAIRKLLMLHAANTLDDLRWPPGNRLEALKENYSGHHSIRVNDQWRIVFVWKNAAAHKVEIVDYH